MESASAPPAVDATRWVAVGCVLALIALSLAWELWLSPTKLAALAAAIKAFPLCLPLPGLLKRRLYTYRWLSLLVWAYAMEGAVRLFDAGIDGRLAALELFLALTLFTACALHIRLRLRKAVP